MATVLTHDPLAKRDVLYLLLHTVVWQMPRKENQMKTRSGLTFMLCSTLLFAAGCTSSEVTPAPATVSSPTTAPPVAPVEALSPAAAQSAAQAEAVNSYRMHIVTLSGSARGSDKVEIDGAFVKQPPADGQRG
jgi:hypothetical protein